MYHFYTIKGIDASITDDNPVGPETVYLDFPYKISISKDALFLIVTTYGGAVHLLRLPDPINPAKLDDQPAAPAEGAPAPNAEASASSFVRPEIDHIEHSQLNFADLLKQTVPAKKFPSQFVDPFEHVEEPVDEEPVENTKGKKAAKEAPKETEEVEVPEEPESGPKFEYKLGKIKYDGDKGDAGYLLRTKGPVPNAYFVSSLYCAKSDDSSNKQLKKVMITTSFVIAYEKLKIVETYGIQSS